MRENHNHLQIDSSSDASLEMLEQHAEGASNGASHHAPAESDTTSAPPQRPRSTATVTLTKFDHELLDAVNETDRHQAGHALLAYGYRFTAGPIDLAAGDWPETTFALLLLRGSLTHQTRAATGQMITFLTRGDLLMPFPPDPLELSGRVSVTATEEVLLAALDQRFIQAAATRPKLMTIIQRRLCEQQHRLALQGAICQLPRVEQRLMALMWQLAERFGKVTADGILITRPLHHQTLADLSGARRPTVSLALKALRKHDHLRRRPDATWLLPSPRATSHTLEDLIDHLKTSPQPPASSPSRSAYALAGPVTAAAARSPTTTQPSRNRDDHRGAKRSSPGSGTPR